MVTTVTENSKTGIAKTQTMIAESHSEHIKTRNQTIERYLPLVRTIAADVCASTSPNVEYDDLVSVGVFGLIDAARGFDEAKNVKFSTYCKRRIRGSMLDELRQLDWVPRLTRQRYNHMRRAETSLEAKLDRKPSNKELAEEMQVDDKEFRKVQSDASLVSLVSLDQLVSQTDDNENKHDSIKDRKAQDPVYELQKKDSKDFLTKSLSKLETLIVTLYYYEQMTMRQIGKTMSLSESRVSQIHTEILDRLRDRITIDKEEFVLAL